MRNSYRHSPGFSLIELMVVVVIIGILASLVMVNYSLQRSRARDTNRRESVAAYKTGLELYKVGSGTYLVQTKQADGTFVGVGYKQQGWGRITREGISNYGNVSIADALLQGGFISRIVLDPRSHTTQDTFNPSDPTTLNDYVLIVCDLDGTQATLTNPSNGRDYAIYANYEHPTAQDNRLLATGCGHDQMSLLTSL